MQTFKYAFLLSLLVAMSSAASAATVYKYVLNENDIIKGKCDDGGEKIASKISMSFSEAGSETLQLHLRVKACTYKLGLKKMSFDFMIPVSLLSEEYLLGLPLNHSQKVGANVWVTREENSQGRAVFSLAPSSFGKQADGVTAIRFSIALDPKERATIMDITHEKFAWSGIHIVYKKGLLMPTVTLRGDLKMVEEE